MDSLAGAAVSPEALRESTGSPARLRTSESHLAGEDRHLTSPDLAFNGVFFFFQRNKSPAYTPTLSRSFHSHHRLSHVNSVGSFPSSR